MGHENRVNDFHKRRRDPRLEVIRRKFEIIRANLKMKTFYWILNIRADSFPHPPPQTDLLSYGYEWWWWVYFCSESMHRKHKKEWFCTYRCKWNKRIVFSVRGCERPLSISEEMARSPSLVPVTMKN